MKTQEIEKAAIEVFGKESQKDIFIEESAELTKELLKERCNNNCPWCIVPKIEGKLKELPIVPGNIIQDNNF